MKKRTLYGIAAILLIWTPVLRAAEQLFSLSFMDAPIEQLVDFYNEWTGRTLIIQTDLTPKITLKSAGKLTKEEAMQAIETVLAQNGVALVPMGEKFLKVVAIDSARQEGMEILPFDSEQEYTPSDQLISQIIPLRYVAYADVQPLIQHLIHGYGKVVQMDRINSVLVTDTSLNIGRIVKLISLVDQPLEKIVPRIYQFKYATAETVAGKLKELIEAARPTNAKTTATVAPRTIPGVIRAPVTRTRISAASNSFADDTQMIQGEVKLVSDERTNILIIFSKAANFDFFDRIIKVLDVPVDPDVVVETVNLEYAEAKDIASVLNDFVGAAKETEETKGTPTKGEAGQSKSVEEVIRAQKTPAREISTTAKNAIGRLSADTKILSDERTNSLLLMGRKSDIEALKRVIASLDIMLQQVLIEAVILNVTIGDTFATGVDWIYERGIKLSDSRTFGPSLGNIATNILSTAVDSATFNYYRTIPKLNIKALIQAAKSDSDARILSTPIVLTTDNTEAKITVADEKPVVTSSTSATSGYSARSTYEYKTIGIDLTVTPHINPNNFVLMEITQSADDVGKDVLIDKNKVPTILKREISATVGVKDRETVILGGLVRNKKEEGASKIPILGDIPLLGWLFSSHSKAADRQELVILLTPYVLNTPEEATSESKRRFNASDSKNTQWPRGWSQSKLSNDEPVQETWKTKHDKKNKTNGKAAVSDEVTETTKK